MNMEKEKIEKLPILPQGMNTKKPPWNNIRYFFRDVHYSRHRKKAKKSVFFLDNL